MAQDYYSILGVSRDASNEEIKKAYRKLAHQHHPDKNAGDKDSETKFKEINNAYQVLGDSQKRSQYDRHGVDPSNMQGGGSQDFGGFSNGRGFDFSGTGGSPFEDLNDVFETFFGNGFSGNSQNSRTSKNPSRRKGIDLEMDLDLTLEEAATGIEKSFNLKHKVGCEHCQGKGSEPGSKVKSCPTCKGSGRVYQRMQTFFGVVQQEVSCPTCEGIGQIYEEKCHICKGKGYNQKNENIEVKIPVGVDSGDRIRVPGKGEAGYKGSQAGDLYLNVNIRSHNKLERKGQDIYSVKEVSYFDLLLGLDLSVYTVWGEVEMKLPPLTNPDSKLKLKGKGMPKLNNRELKGDHFVEIKVKMPRNLDKKQQEVLQKVRDELK
jgi:molecular chaperone DnaJ